MKKLIQETLWRKVSRIRKDNKRVDSMLCGLSLIFLKYMSYTFDRMSLELAPQKSHWEYVFGYFVRNYLAARAKRQESICSPEYIECIDKLAVAMVGPMKGKIFDPCCGVGGMLVESHAFMLHKLHLANTSLKNLVKTTDQQIVLYGQESSITNYRLCRMNLAIHGVDGTQIGWNNECCLEKDLYPNLKADYIFCAPFINSRYSNSDWIRYIISHLSLGGVACVVLSKDSLSSSSSILAAMTENNELKKMAGNTRVICIVALPDQLFQSTGMSSCLWLFGRGKGRISGTGKQDSDVLFIDLASNIPGVPRKIQYEELSNPEIDEIAGTFRRWQAQNGDYKDVKGFCKSLDWKTIKRNHFNLTPERYV